MKPKITLLLISIVALASCHVTQKKSKSGSSGPEATMIKTYYIAPVRVSCTGAGPMTCLLVKHKMNERWTTFYEPIKGFDHHWGTTYIARVKISNRENQPADASLLQYELVEIVEQKQVSQELSGLHDIYGIMAINGNPVKEKVYQSLELNTADMRFMGKAACNSFNGRLMTKDNWNGIAFTDMINTSQTCPEQEIEDAYLQALQAVDSYYRFNNTLLLFKGENVLIEARRMD